MPSRALFIDKDGTLIRDVPYNVDPERIALLPGAREALSMLAEAGWKLIVITNQPGVALGLFDESALQPVRERLEQLLHPVPLTAFYYCPHAPMTPSCKCRKPEAGLILTAAADHDIDLNASWIIGDILHDIEAGHRAGCRSILLDVGNETEWEITPARLPDARVQGWNELVALLHAMPPLRRPACKV